jgi:ABC-type transporter Mla subunit MlaD
MSAKANYFKLGMFILLAVVVGIAGVLVLGAARFFEKKTIIETYLEQSAQGIDVGSKVKYRGVSIGSVRRISFTRNHYAPAKTSPSQHSYVLLELELKSTPFGEMVPDSVERDLPREVRHGLRAQLTAQGVTGTAYIEIDYLDPTRSPLLPIEWEPAHPYIPSAPSTLSRIFTSVQEVFAELNQINFTNIASAAEMLIARLDQKVGELPVALLSTNAVGLLEEVRDSNRRIQKLLDRPEITATLQDLSGAATGFRQVAELPALTNSVVQLERTLRRLEQLAAGKDHDLEASLDNLRGLTENLRELSENAKRFPAQLLFGEPPKPSKTLP